MRRNTTMDVWDEGSCIASLTEGVRGIYREKWFFHDKQSLLSKITSTKNLFPK